MTLSLAHQLTVAFVLHNEAHRLRDLASALEAVEGLGQVHRVIFVDNASTDATLTILNEYKKSSPLKITILSRNSNHMGKARGDVLTHSATKWVLFCDGDCLPHPNWLLRYERVVRELGPKLGSVYAGVGGPARPLIAGKERALAEILGFFKWTHLGSAQGALKGESWDADHLPCSNVLMDRELVLQNGGFSSALNRVGEDLELGLRLRSKGLLWRVAPELELHHQRDFSLRKWAVKMIHYGKAQILVGRLRQTFHPRALAGLGAGVFGILWILLLFLNTGWAALIGLFYFLGVAAHVSSCPRVRLQHRIYGFFLIPTTHICYALGALIEFVAPRKSLG